MVCGDCEKKGSSVACPDPWKDGARDSADRKMNDNKLLNKNKRKMASPYGSGGAKSLYGSKCTTCKQQLHQPGKYCASCAYKGGVCSMCGKKILDTRAYKQSAT
ncbi:postsynaptic-related protein [Planoprotostelium fungivorum]|uniref:Cysteine-rich PDZ-binding protein n=1 Tax=Planoprotostelium fungivorum TaxID=1890364 RepID=A0A2P6P0J7_9EUKA|nr:postsynaptic-related protein [Planoprotostelium fungivorum]